MHVAFVWFRKWTILIHRYLGMALSLLLAVWFISGIAMIYARGMPGLTPDSRLEHLPALDLSNIRLSPAEALEKAQLERPGRIVLLTIMERPAYRIGARGAVTVFADNGEFLEEVGRPEALKIASGFAGVPESRLRYAGEVIEPDQWTIVNRRALPMHKVAVDDEAHTELYISEETAEAGFLTTRGSRALAWIAAIPHWLYFTKLRSNDQLWRRIVLWTSGAAAFLTLAGLILGITQFSTRYAGLMRWHYVTGVVFGVFALTWAFSGLLSMEPFFWASEEGFENRIPQALSGGALDVDAFPRIDAAKWGEVLSGRRVKELQFARIQGRPFYIARGVEPEPLLISAEPLQIRREPFPLDSMMNRIQEASRDVSIIDSTVLSEYDSYYYPRERKPPLPVLRVKFADAAGTWVYVDPHMSQVVRTMTRRQRLQRWIYNGLHSLDFNFWYYQGAAWQVTMVALNAGGAALAVIGVILTFKRLARSGKKWARQFWPRREIRFSNQQSAISNQR